MAWQWPLVLGTASSGYGTDLTGRDFGEPLFLIRVTIVHHCHAGPLPLLLLITDALVFFSLHYPTILQSVKEVRTSSEEPPLALSVSLTSHVNLRSGEQTVLCIYPPFFMLVCITYALLTVFGCSGLWILVMGVLAVPVFFSCIFFFLCLQSRTYMPHIVANVMKQMMMLPQYCRPSVFDLIFSLH